MPCEGLVLFVSVPRLRSRFSPYRSSKSRRELSLSDSFDSTGMFCFSRFLVSACCCCYAVVMMVAMSDFIPVMSVWSWFMWDCSCCCVSLMSVCRVVVLQTKRNERLSEEVLATDTAAPCFRQVRRHSTRRGGWRREKRVRKADKNYKQTRVGRWVSLREFARLRECVSLRERGSVRVSERVSPPESRESQQRERES